MSTDNPICTDCGHPRSDHADEMPYECCGYDEDYCECQSFSYIPKEALAMTDAGEKLLDRASQYWHVDSNLEKNEVDALVEFCRAELERAAQMVDTEMKYWQACAYSSDDPTIRIAQLSKMRLLEEVAASIRKLEE